MSTDNLLILTESLFKMVNPNIITQFVIKNGIKSLLVSNVTEADFINIELITNKPQYLASLRLVEIKTTIGSNIDSTYIYGLFENITSIISSSNTQAIATNNFNTYKPFQNGFKNGIPVGTLIDTLSSLSNDLPNTFQLPKVFSFCFQAVLNSVPANPESPM